MSRLSFINAFLPQHTHLFINILIQSWKIYDSSIIFLLSEISKYCIWPTTGGDVGEKNSVGEMKKIFKNEEKRERYILDKVLWVVKDKFMTFFGDS